MFQTLILIKENTAMIIRKNQTQSEEQMELTSNNIFPSNPAEEKVGTVLQTNTRIKTVLSITHANDDDDDRENDMDLRKMYA